MQFSTFVITIFLIAIKLIAIQAKFDIIYEDVEIVVESEEYFKDIDVHVTDDNSGVFVNLTIIKRFPDDTRATMALIGQSMGQYVVQSTINFDVGLCQLFDSEHSGMYGTQFKKFGFSRDDCPPSPGTYFTEKFTFDTSTVPDRAPSNNYLLKFKLTTGNVNIYEGHLYIRIISQMLA